MLLSCYVDVPEPRSRFLVPLFPVFPVFWLPCTGAFSSSSPELGLDRDCPSLPEPVEHMSHILCPYGGLPCRRCGRVPDDLAQPGCARHSVSMSREPSINSVPHSSSPRH